MSYDLKVFAGDLVLDQGDLKIVIDGEKLIQDILKIALTEAGSNPQFPGYGSYISRTLVGSSLETGITMQFAQSQLQNSIQNLKDLQQMQSKSGQQVSADEQIKSILGISVERNISDPRQFNVSIKVLSKGFKPVTATFKLTR